MQFASYRNLAVYSVAVMVGFTVPYSWYDMHKRIRSLEARFDAVMAASAAADDSQGSVPAARV